MDTAYGILGRTALSIDGATNDDWGRPKERAVLGTLLVHTGRWVSVDTLIQWGWPEDTAQPLNRGPTFHHYAGRIRKWLRQMPSAPTLHAENGGYRLDIDKSLIDYYRFTGLLSEARAHAKQNNPQSAADVTLRALNLWRGRPLDDLAGEPAQAWRLRVMHDDWLGAHRTLLAALLELREFDEVLSRVGDLHTDHPNDVTLATQRMSALHGLGRYPDEVAYYFDIRRRLQDDSDESAVAHVRRHHESLRAAAAAPTPAPSPPPAVVPRGLGHDVRDFVGRAALLADLDAVIADEAGGTTSGVVVIEGMAGVGKTALAKHWGHRARQHFADGQLYVDLNGFSDEARVPQSTVVDDFLIALGHSPDNQLTGRARELLLTRMLAGRRVLVVLDNARDARHVEHLVELFPEALVVVTSRQQLGGLSAMIGARRVRIDPLSAGEAVTLLAKRIGTRREVAPTDLERLAALCGGLPLMLTLLAEQIATSPPDQITEFADQLDRRQLICDVGDDSGAVSAFFQWSYRLLTDEEQRLLRLIGLHPGADISLRAALAMDGRGRAETMRGLRALVGAHLLDRPDALDRYRCHDLVREFAAHRAESDEPAAERQAALRRAASFYLASTVNADHALYPSRLNAAALPVEDGVEPAEFTGVAQAQTWFGKERTNLLAMIRCAAANDLHGHAWRLSDAAVAFFDRHGYYEDCLSMQKVAALSAKVLGDQVGEASTLMGLGRVHLTLGDLVDARRYLDAALRGTERIGHEAGQAAALNLLGKLEVQRGDLAAALDLYRRSMKIAQKTDDVRGLCWTSCRIGEVLRAAEQHDRALVYLTRAQILAERMGDQSAYATTMMEIGLVHGDRGDHTSAAMHCAAALRVAEEIPDQLVTAEACIALAEINRARGRSRDATRYAIRAIDISEDNTAARAYDVLGDTYFASGDPNAAATAWQEAAERYTRMGNPARATVARSKLMQVPGADVELPWARSASPSNLTLPLESFMDTADRDARPPL